MIDCIILNIYNICRLDFNIKYKFNNFYKIIIYDLLIIF